MTLSKPEAVGFRQADADDDEDGYRSDITVSSTETFAQDNPRIVDSVAHENPNSSLSSFVPLFEKISAISFTTGTYVIRGRILPAERKAVLSYARHITTFTSTNLSPRVRASDMVFMRMAKLPHSDSPFFPNLERLVIERLAIPTSALNLFLTPSLKHLTISDIPEAADDELCNILHSLVEEANALSSVTIGPFISSTKCLSALGDSTSLSSLNIHLPDNLSSPFDLSILDTFGRLPYLQTFKINAGTNKYTPQSPAKPKGWQVFSGDVIVEDRSSDERRFTKVQTLEVSGRLELVDHVLAAMRNIPLRALSITLQWPLAESPPARPHVCSVCDQPLGFLWRRKDGVCGEACQDARIARASVYFNRLVEAFLGRCLEDVASICLRVEGRPNVRESSCSFSSDLLRKCLAFHKLKSLYIHGWAVDACDLDSILRIEHGALTHLSLPLDTCPDINLGTFKLLIFGCPSLLSLQCRLKLEVPMPFDYPPVSHRLQTLIAGTSPDQWSRAVAVCSERVILMQVARYFHRLVPTLCDTIPALDYCDEQWREVFDLFRLCREAAKDDKNRVL